MSRMGFPSLVVLFALVAHIHEVDSTAMKLKSTQEIMNRTTVESAIKLVFGMDATKPELAALLQRKFGHATGAGTNLRNVNHHIQQDEPTGYAAIESAVNMLADMMAQTMSTFDELESSCSMFHRNQFDLMHEAKDAIAFHSSEANSALAHMLDANGKISSFSGQLHGLEDRRREVEHQCAEDLESTRGMLNVVSADVNVMESILNMTQCGGQDDGTSLLQTGTESLAQAAFSNHGLVSCGYCRNGKGMILLQSPQVQPLLNKLQSLYANDELQKQLHLSFHRAAKARTPVVLSQLGVAHQIKLGKSASSAAATGARLRKRLHERASNDTLAPAAYSLDVADTPQDPVPADCVPTSQCTLSEANCPLIQERFENIHGGLLDKVDELTEELSELERYCQKETQNLEGQISTLGERVEQEQAIFAGANGDKETAEAGTFTKAREYDMLQHEYNTRSQECCDQLNEARSEQCALKKIREELAKLEGINLFAIDCEVSEWVEQECTVTCGGGERVSTREILANPQNGGMQCPELRKVEPCNDLPCPVNCELNDWGGFGACNTECGGGLRERTRSVLVEPQHYGDPCGERTDTEPCNSQACDADCVLDEWTPWTSCSAFCNGGTQRRTRGIAEEARGIGTCAAADAEPDRLQFQRCNMDTCESMLPPGRSTVKCVSKVDVVVVLDGSGSLGQRGWDKTRELGEKLIRSMAGGENVHVALLLFSYRYEWISHFTSDTAAVAGMIPTMAWPQSVTYTDSALFAARGELFYGREDTNKVVIVVTDGYPSRPRNTYMEAKKLQQEARVVWVPIGYNAPFELINHLASKPIHEHVIPILDIDEMGDSDKINNVLAHTCPKLA